MGDSVSCRMTVPNALVSLADAGKLRRPYLFGMMFDFWRYDEIRDQRGIGAKQAELPDFEDPATKGCLLAQLREAMDRPALCLDVHYHEDTDEPHIRAWNVWDPEDDWEGPRAPTEGEAIASALIAFAQAL